MAKTKKPILPVACSKACARACRSLLPAPTVQVAVPRSVLKIESDTIAALVAAAEAARVCLSEASNHHGTAVRGCAKCEKARQAMSAIDRALNKVRGK